MNVQTNTENICTMPHWAYGYLNQREGGEKTAIGPEDTVTWDGEGERQGKHKGSRGTGKRKI